LLAVTGRPSAEQQKIFIRFAKVSDERFEPCWQIRGYFTPVYD
jgi:hypothetical protein